MGILQGMLVLSIVTAVVCIVALFVIYHNQSIVALLYKINLSEQKIDDALKNKEDYIKRVIRLIENKLKIEIKSFQEFKTLSENMTNQEKDVLLNGTFNDIKVITEDNDILSQIKNYDSYIDEIKVCDVMLGGIKTMNNKYVSLYNNVINKNFKKLISKFKHYQVKTFYELCEIKEIEL